MMYKIADLYVEIPDAGGLAPRYGDYLCVKDCRADLELRAEQFRATGYPEWYSWEQVAFMEAGRIFYTRLLEYDGLYVHSSAVAMDGKAYLFSGPSGMGKSTHTRLWQQVFGEKAQVFNDDKPAVRRLDGSWYAYGTPWCGKDDIQQNRKVPLVGICFLKRGEKNTIRRLSGQEACIQLISQTFHKFKSEERMLRMLRNVELLARDIPVFELHCTPEPEAALLSYDTMRKCAEELDL